MKWLWNVPIYSPKLRFIIYLALSPGVRAWSEKRHEVPCLTDFSQPDVRKRVRSKQISKTEGEKPELQDTNLRKSETIQKKSSNQGSKLRRASHRRIMKIVSEPSCLLVQQSLRCSRCPVSKVVFFCEYQGMELQQIRPLKVSGRVGTWIDCTHIKHLKIWHILPKKIYRHTDGK